MTGTLSDIRRLLFLCLLLTAAGPEPVSAQGFKVTAQVSLQPARPAGVRNVVVWLEREDQQTDSEPATPDGSREHYRMVQKDKQFTPHLLIVPVGSSVDFPNLDPFYHNVFSLFNGRRFDLGLYESGSTRAVSFNHAGVSYIFCNIHPNMSAVVVSLATPYYAEAAANGRLSIPNVPQGYYGLKVWAEGATTQTLQALSRRVHVGDGQTDLGPLTIAVDTQAQPHANKFGQEYPAATKPPY